MKQYDIINDFIKTLVNNEYIDLCLLKGSFARKREDEYSNIEFYFHLNLEKEEEFFDNYYNLLSKYGSILYHKLIFNDIIIVYKNNNYDENFISIIIHLTDLKDIKYDNDFIVLYDKGHLLDNFNYSLEYSKDEIGEKIDKLSLLTLEFLRMYKRNDLSILLNITLRIEECYVSIIRYFKDKETSKLIRKEFLSVLDKDERLRYLTILKKIKIDSLKDAVILMLEDISNVFKNLDLTLASKFDYDFYMYMLKSIKNME